MTVEVVEVRKGDSSPIYLFKLKGIAVGTCTCKQVVRRDLATAADIDAAVTDTVTHTDGEDYFQVMLTSTQTDGLVAERVYLWIAEITCAGATPGPQRKEWEPRKLHILTEGAT